MPTTLRNVLEHKKNTEVNVDGTIYKIDKDGLCEGLSDVDAEALLQNPEAWHTYPRNSMRPEPPPPEKKPPSGGMKLVLDDGSVVDPAKEFAKKEETPPETAEEAEQEATEEVVTKSIKEASEESSGDEEPQEEGEWPEPSEDMDLTYLRQMADAYEVKYTGRTGKKKLVTDITAAMYGEE